MGLLEGEWKRTWKLLYYSILGLNIDYIGILEKKMETSIYTILEVRDAATT